MNSHLKYEKQKELKDTFPNVFRLLMEKPDYTFIQKVLRKVFFTTVRGKVLYAKLRTSINFLPSLYLHREPIQAYGIEAPDGWFDLLHELSSDLETVIRSKPKKERKYYYVTQCKEKFGTLRFYMSKESPSIEFLVGKAEDKSSSICQMCGKPARLRTKGGWWKTVCDEHERK
jgi:hypothetical protein